MENRARPDNMFAPMTYWGLKQQRREEQKGGAAGGGRFEERSKGPIDRDFEERLKVRYRLGKGIILPLTNFLTKLR